jgi:hypothetical protein
MSWNPWTDKSKDVPFESTEKGIGHGEHKVGRELDTRVFGPNFPYDMKPILNGVETVCDVKKLDTQDDFNTAKKGRDALRSFMMLHTKLLDSLPFFAKSNIFLDDQKTQLVRCASMSPAELAVGSLQQIEGVCKMLHSKKNQILSKLPLVPCTFGRQTKEVRLDFVWQFCKENEEYSCHREEVLVVRKMNQVYIDKPNKFMEDLHSLAHKLFENLKIIIVDEVKGFMIIENTSAIQFLRITRGSPRFKVLFQKLC